MWARGFWIDSAERAIKTVAQSAVAVLGSGAIGVLAVDWVDVTSVSLLAGVVSLLTSIASSSTGDRGTPSLVSKPPA